MPHKLHVFFSLLLLSLLGGCSMSHLSYGNERLAIQVEDNHLSVNGTSIGHHTEYFKDLTLTQESLRLDAGNVVVYEEAKTDRLYEFNLATVHSIKAIFDAKKVTTVYSQSEFSLFQLQFQDDSILNVAAEQHDDQRLALIYGISTDQLKNILHSLGGSVQKPLIEEVLVFKDDNNIILSKWSMQTIYFTPLIVPVRYFNAR